MDLLELFRRAVGAADPAICVPRHLPEPPAGRTLVLAAGKAAASMAAAVERRWPAHAPLRGLAVTRDGHGVPCERIEVIEAAHPVPDARGRDAAARALQLASDLRADDLLLFLVSGGGSSLLVQPAPGVDLAEKQRINRALLRSGAPIGAINVVRRHLSAIKGGWLAAAAHPARVVTLGISDVPGDDPITIASGPTVADPTSVDDARAVLARYDIRTVAPLSETPKPGEAAFERATFTMVATPRTMLDAVIENVRDVKVMDLGADVEGEAREVAANHADLAREAAKTGEPTLILSGGETTVTVTGESGRGGRNCEYLLSLAVALDGHPDVRALAADTDGIDGSEDNAGAVCGPDTLARARELGLDAREHLARHDSHAFFQRLDSLIVTGPTRTNVNDFRAIAVNAPT